jgi:hypothetical protein
MAVLLFYLFFDFEEASSTFHENIGELLPDYMASHYSVHSHGYENFVQQSFAGFMCIISAIDTSLK